MHTLFLLSVRKGNAFPCEGKVIALESAQIALPHTECVCTELAFPSLPSSCQNYSSSGLELDLGLKTRNRGEVSNREATVLAWIQGDGLLIPARPWGFYGGEWGLQDLFSFYGLDWKQPF